MEEFKRIDRKVVYNGAILQFCQDEIITPKGNQVKWDYLEHNAMGGAQAAAGTSGGETA